MFQDVVIRNIGQNRGRPRVFLDMPALARADFVPGAIYKLEINQAEMRVVLTVDKDGDRVVSSKVKGETKLSVIDLSSFRVLNLFEGFSRLRIIFMCGRIYVMPLASDLAQRERITRTVGKLQRGEPLAMASMFHGVGLMSNAAHAGLEDAGLVARNALVTEIDEDYIEHSRSVNPVWAPSTRGLTAPAQELMQDEWVFGRLPKVDVFEAGPPCSGASKAGVTKGKLPVMEAHEQVGHMIVPTLAVINKVQPSVVVIENVDSYADSGSAYIARNMLRDMGYKIQEVILNAADFGCLEARRRWFMVASTTGLDIDLSCLEPSVKPVAKISDILDPVPDDDSSWSNFAHLKEKAQRDKAEGKGFKMQTVTADSTTIGVLRKGYNKCGSTDPLLEHPSGDGRLRKLSVAEHARIKNFDPALFEGLGMVKGHEMLGQGVAKEPVKALFKRIGEALLAASRKVGDSFTPTLATPTLSLKGTG